WVCSYISLATFAGVAGAVVSTAAVLCPIVHLRSLKVHLHRSNPDDECLGGCHLRESRIRVLATFAVAAAGAVGATVTTRRHFLGEQKKICRNKTRDR
ncbi:hypothetical protein P5F15_16560, partial [Clostridium perfringens]|nr:hypothetical protein [Clostridium perfringens]